MRMTVRALRRHSDEVLWAEIHAIEGQSCLILLQLDHERRVLTDDHGRTLCFPGLAAANEFLRGYRVLQRELVHQSAYNEMIGLDESAIGPLRIQTGRQG